MKRVFCAAALLAASATVAQAQAEPESYQVSVSFGYELSQGTANQLGVSARGDISATMNFVRPDCLGSNESTGAAYPATYSQVKAFGKESIAGLSRSNQMIVRNDFYGNDWVQLNLDVGSIRLGSQRLASIVLNAGQLPTDAVSSNAFITDGDLLEDILEYQGLNAYGQFAGSSTSDFALTVTGVRASISHTPFRPTTASQYATCASPAGQP